MLMTEKDARTKFCPMIHPLVITGFRCVTGECPNWVQAPGADAGYCVYLNSKEDSCESTGRVSRVEGTTRSAGSTTTSR